MPIFEYECPAGHTQDRLSNSHKDRPDTVECRTCGQQAQFKVSAPSFYFKDGLRWGEGTQAKIDTVEEAWDGLPPALAENAKERKDRIRLKREGAKPTVMT